MSELNPTGIVPVEYKVLIEVEEVESRTSGGIFIPEIRLERNQEAHDRGRLVEKSEMAFSDWKGRKPQVGDKILFDRYAGSVIEYQSKDRSVRRFRLCEDKKIGAIVEEKDNGRK